MVDKLKFLVYNIVMSNYVKLTPKLVEKGFKDRFKKGYVDREDYKFTLEFCKTFPDAQIAKGYPTYLIANVDELICEVLNSTEFTSAANDENLKAFCSFVDSAIAEGYSNIIIFGIFWGVYRAFNKTHLEDVVKNFKAKTKKLWQQFCEIHNI